jgi:hypothetical protein
MVTRDARDDEYRELGYIVLHAACAAYRSEHAGRVDCVDESWHTVP